MLGLTDQFPLNFVWTSLPTQGRFLLQVWPRQPNPLVPQVACKVSLRRSISVGRNWERWWDEQEEQESQWWPPQSRKAAILNYLSINNGEFKLEMGWVNFLWLGSGQTFMVWVWILKISPKNIKFFNLFPFGSKKIASGRIGKYPGQSRIGLLFIVKSKLGSGHGPSLVLIQKGDIEMNQ